MRIRTAVMADLAAVTAVEAACFPEAEAAKEQDFFERLKVYPNHFWLLEDEKSRDFKCGYKKCTVMRPSITSRAHGR